VRPVMADKLFDSGKKKKKVLQILISQKIVTLGIVMLRVGSLTTNFEVKYIRTVDKSLIITALLALKIPVHFNY